MQPKKRRTSKEITESNYELYRACVQVRWPETGDQEVAMKYILGHPKISNKISYEATRLSDMNVELDKGELQDNICSILCIAIKKEFKLEKDPSKIEGWICSRIEWRTLDAITKELEIDYYAKDADSNKSTGHSGSYKRIEKVYTSDSSNNRDLIESMPTNKIDSEISALSQSGGETALQNLNDLEFFIRNSTLDPKLKQVLILHLNMGYSFRELSEIHECSTHAARNLYKKAVQKLSEYVREMPKEEQQMIYHLLSGEPDSS